MHFLMIVAHPNPANQDYGTIDGAYVTLYINEALVTSPETAARALVEGQGWDIAEIAESYPITLESLPNDHPGRHSYEQALIEGIVARFNTWPLQRRRQ